MDIYIRITVQHIVYRFNRAVRRDAAAPSTAHVAVPRCVLRVAATALVACRVARRPLQ